MAATTKHLQPCQVACCCFVLPVCMCQYERALRMRMSACSSGPSRCRPRRGCRGCWNSQNLSLPAHRALQLWRYNALHSWSAQSRRSTE